MEYIGLGLYVILWDIVGRNYRIYLQSNLVYFWQNYGIYWSIGYISKN